jgi:hypothetical protein
VDPVPAIGAVVSQQPCFDDILADGGSRRTPGGDEPGLVLGVMQTRPVGLFGTRAKAVIIDKMLIVVFCSAVGRDHEGDERKGIQQQMEPCLVVRMPAADRFEFQLVHRAFLRPAAALEVRRYSEAESTERQVPSFDFVPSPVPALLAGDAIYTPFIALSRRHHYVAAAGSVLPSSHQRHQVR